LPESQVALGIKCGQGFNEVAALRTAKTKLGFTDEELKNLQDGILRALAQGPLTTANLKEKLGSLVSNYGEAGKKVGQTTSLSLGLLTLQSQAKIRRIPINGRLDTQTYEYELFSNPPIVNDSYPSCKAYTDLARLYWSWVGFATSAHFQWFSGLGVRIAAEAIKEAGIEPVQGSDLMAAPQTMSEFNSFELPVSPIYCLLSSLDSLFLLRREIASLIEPVDAAMQTMSTCSGKNLLGSPDLSHHAIVDRGRLVGIWEFDPDDGKIVFSTFSPPESRDLLLEQVETTERFVQELGDARSFSLDSAKSRRPAIEFVKQVGARG
jgi:hypothetical protein